MAITAALDTLMDFRFAYLRAIAYSWTLWKPGQPVEEQDRFIRRLLSGENILPLLQGSVKDGPGFGMRCGWPDFAVCLAYDPKPSWEKPATGWRSVPPFGWVGVDDQFIITLPQKPRPVSDGGLAVLALADYYKRWPTIMGQDDADHGEVKGMGIPGAAAGGGQDALLEFGSVVLRAIALAWQDPVFLSALTAPDLPDASTVLSQYLGYNNPFNFQITFSTDGSLTWGPDGNGGGTWDYQGPSSGGLTQSKPNAVLLRYPAPPMQYPRPDHPPTLDKSVWPFALASYNNTGPAYPFTCMGG